LKIFTLPSEEGNQRHQEFMKDSSLGSYMLFVKEFCIDATSETGRLGRLLNHSRSAPNLKAWQLPNEKRVVMKAIQDIPAGTQLTWDYGEEDTEVLKELPWLKK